MHDIIGTLIQLSREIGREDRRLALLAEGNTSARAGEGRFAVKASGCSLATLGSEDITLCESAKILASLDGGMLPDREVESVLLGARVNGQGKKPSVEAMFHAWLLTLDDVHFVGHCHPVATNQILCSPGAAEFARNRLFPDEVVCCGPESVLVPYVDPGIPLAKAIRDETTRFIQKKGLVPRLILLQNHGIIALGKTPNAVLACLQMAEKAAEIFVGASLLGGPVFMTADQINRIAKRPDEAYRQRQLKM
ncbi:MAG TPA: class II aldolase/adducin family protein [Verrucomicrobiae bacterium]|nr:class II aldolase/adducin family protein [Verrucomicrobiae bacterium]